MAIELDAAGTRVVVDSQVEAIVPKPREDVEVDMEDLLPRRFAVGEEEVDPVGCELASAESAGMAHAGSHQVGTRLLGKIGEVGCVLLWHHEEVARVDRVDVHEAEHGGVLEHDAARRLVANDPTERALIADETSPRSRPHPATAQRGSVAAMARHTMRSVAAGAVAGAVGTLAMDLLWYGRFRKGGGTQDFVSWETSEGTVDYEHAAAPARTAQAVAALAGVELPDASARTVNNLVHWGTGIGWGEAHGFVSALTGVTSPLMGPVTAVLAWATSYVVLPKLGVYQPIGEYDRDVLLQDLTAHLTFGAALGIAYRLLAGSSD